MKYLCDDRKTREVPVTSQQRAAEIMGKNFFGIDEAVRYLGICAISQEDFMTLLGIPFTAETIAAIDKYGLNPMKQQLTALYKVPFSEERLMQDKDTHVLVAVFPISILEIEKNILNKRIFQLPDKYRNYTFANEHHEAAWHLVRKTHVEGSTGTDWKNAKSYKEQKELLSSIDQIPSARVILYTIIGCYISTGEILFEEFNVRTSSRIDPTVSTHRIKPTRFDTVREANAKMSLVQPDSKIPYHVCVSGLFRGRILMIDQFDNSNLFYVGLASERKPSEL
jgi:hypothetical protein